MNQQIDKYVESQREKFLKDLDELNKIPSVSVPQEGKYPYGEASAKAIDKTMEICKQMGFETKNVDYYCMDASYGGKPKLGILTHLDVMPVNEAEWNTPAFGCTEMDGKLYGRGVTDDKGPALASIYALKCIKDLGIPLKGGVRLIFGAAEELGDETDLEYYWKSREVPEMVFSPDAYYPVVNGEKGILRMINQKENLKTDSSRSVVTFDGGEIINNVPDLANALLCGVTKQEAEEAIQAGPSEIQFTVEPEGDNLRIKAVGKLCHSMDPSKGKNAITGLIAVLNRLNLKGEIADIMQKMEQVFPHGDYYGKVAGVECDEPCLGKTTVNFGVLHFDGKDVDLRLECRFALKYTMEENQEILKKAIAKIGLNFKEYNVTLDTHFVNPEGNKMVDTLLDVYHDATGLEKECITIGGATYVHNIPNGVAFGPCYDDRQYFIHESNEQCDTQELIDYIKIMAEVIVKLCG